MKNLKPNPSCSRRHKTKSKPRALFCHGSTKQVREHATLTISESAFSRRKRRGRAWPVSYARLINSMLDELTETLVTLDVPLAPRVRESLSDQRVDVLAAVTEQQIFCLTLQNPDKPKASTKVHMWLWCRRLVSYDCSLNKHVFPLPPTQAHYCSGIVACFGRLRWMSPRVHCGFAGHHRVSRSSVLFPPSTAFFSCSPGDKNLPSPRDLCTQGAHM